VGIGTAAPIYPLQIASASVSGIGVVISNVTGNYAQLGFVGTGHSYQVGVGNAAAGSMASKYFVYDSNGSVFRMVIDSSGNVGIGTTTPTNLLSLSGAAAPTFWMERGTAAGNRLTVQAGGGLSGGTNENGGTLTLASGISTGTGLSGINFNIYKAAGSTGTADNAATTAMTITGAGNVGIGTTAPATLLHVRSAASTDAEGRVDVTSGFNKSILGLANGGTDFGQLYFDNSNNNLVLIQKYTLGNLTFGTNSAERMSIDINGNVGIGTTSPDASLDISQKTDAVSLPVGTTGTRPTGVNGMIRYNSAVPGLEAYVNGVWSTLQSSGTTSGVLGVANGGTGDSTLTAHGVVVGEGTSPLATTSAGAIDTVLVGNGASSDPTFSASPILSGTITDLQSIGSTSTDGVVLQNTKPRGEVRQSREPMPVPSGGSVSTGDVVRNQLAISAEPLAWVIIDKELVSAASAVPCPRYVTACIGTINRCNCRLPACVNTVAVG
jgi:hypothetical protein